MEKKKPLPGGLDTLVQAWRRPLLRAQQQGAAGRAASLRGLALGRATWTARRPQRGIGALLSGGGVGPWRRPRRPAVATAPTRPPPPTRAAWTPRPAQPPRAAVARLRPYPSAPAQSSCFRRPCPAEPRSRRPRLHRRAFAVLYKRLKFEAVSQSARSGQPQPTEKKG
jgi:hypothetical protein